MAKHLAKFDIGGRMIYVHPTGLRVGSRGKVLPPREAMAGMDKAEKRRLRRVLHKNGFGGLAHASL